MKRESKLSRISQLYRFPEEYRAERDRLYSVIAKNFGGSVPRNLHWSYRFYYWREAVKHALYRIFCQPSWMREGPMENNFRTFHVVDGQVIRGTDK